MRNGRWLTAKDVLRVNAFKWPNKIGVKDLIQIPYASNSGTNVPADSQMRSQTWV